MLRCTPVIISSMEGEQVLALRGLDTYWRPQRCTRLYFPYAWRALPTWVVAFSGMAYFVDAVRDSTCSHIGRSPPMVHSKHRP